MESGIIIAKKGNVFQRKHDNQVFGNKIVLGYDFSTGIKRKDKEEYYREIQDPDCEHDWHKEHEDKKFQVILTEKQAVELVMLKPDFAFLNNNTIQEDGFVYIYVNYLEEEDKQILEQNNIIINFHVYRSY